MLVDVNVSSLLITKKYIISLIVSATLNDTKETIKYCPSNNFLKAGYAYIKERICFSAKIRRLSHQSYCRRLIDSSHDSSV